MASLSTERLTLRPLSQDDADAVHALMTSPAVARVLWDGRTIPIAETRELLERNDKLFAESQYGLWGAWLNDRPRLVTLAGLWFFHERPVLELIYATADDLCGQGYATEAAAAVLHYAFERLGMDVVRASTDAPNHASQRVLEKLGFTLVRRGKSGALDSLFYERRLDPDEAIELPTLADLTASPPATCSRCGSEAVRTDSPASRWTLLIGGGLSAWILVQGQVSAAVMLVITTITLAAGIRARFQYRRCDRCGHEWSR